MQNRRGPWQQNSSETDAVKKDGSPEWIVNEYFLDEAGNRIYVKKDKREISANIPDLSPKAQQIEDVLKGIVSKIGGDHAATDISRVLRVPGTLNRKNQRTGKTPVPCTLYLFEPDRRYSIDQFLPLAECSPDRKKRELLKKVKLPRAGKLTAKKEGKLNELLLVCDAEKVGDRSEADFHACCHAIEHGISRDDVWRLAQTVGKFASDGERYFDRTWKKAETRTREKIYDKTVGKRNAAKAAKAAADDSSDTAETFGNVVFVPGEGDTEKAEPVPMQLIVVNLIERVGKDLHKTASKLFAHVQGETKIDWLLSTASLFGWIQSKLGTINWNRGNNLVTKDEFAAELLRCVSPVAAVEKLPHFPPIDGHYYLCPPPTPGDGKALANLIGRYKFATEYDRELATAMFVTAVWGGPPGCRPAWLITSQLGRGRGKSTLAQHMAEMFGGCVDISPNEDITVVKKRLLSKEAEFVRIGLLDNLKSTRFSWGEFEAMLTLTEINGWEVYVGDSRRPNLLTWIITLNGASLSTDMARARYRNPARGTILHRNMGRGLAEADRIDAAGGHCRLRGFPSAARQADEEQQPVGNVGGRGTFTLRSSQRMFRPDQRAPRSRRC